MYRILLADDDFNIREPFTDYLTAKGFSVVAVKNGAEAVSRAEKEAFDLILLDVLMPKRTDFRPAGKSENLRMYPFSFFQPWDRRKIS